MAMDQTLLKLTGIGHILCADSIELSVWEGLVHKLEVALASAPQMTLMIGNPERKWELVSAYQKSVRQGNYELAAPLVSAMVSMDTERPYMWKRIGTTSAEDVGAGGLLVMKFVLACHSLYNSAKLPRETALPLWLLLTELMCEAGKSRMYCQFSILGDALRSTERKYMQFDKSEYGQRVKSILKTDFSDNPGSPADSWLVKANWRAEGMAVGPLQIRALGGEQEFVPDPVVPHRILKGLPSFCYDMHTRVGKTSITRACGLPKIKTAFQKAEPFDRAQAVGWALFLEEGGKVCNRLRIAALDEFEHQVIAERHQVLPEQWSDIRAAVAEELLAGSFDNIREQVLNMQRY